MNLRIPALVLAAGLAAGCSSNKAPAPAAKPAPAAQKPAAARPVDGKVVVQATADGFTPSRIEAEAGKPLTLVFVRVAEKSCMTSVIFPELGIEKDLPLNEEVAIEIEPKADGPITFQCPMGMGKSAVIGLPKA
ncbi:MAG TPA: cupredoxin domain-containing protein [Vulgatibacter sp.]|nr:cupredoxin domain-containing protein [Vulgatibacter sp.]